MLDIRTVGGDGEAIGLPEWAAKPKRRRRRRTPDPAMPPMALRSRRRWYSKGKDGHLGNYAGTLDVIVASAEQWERMPESKREKEDNWEVSYFASGWIMAFRFEKDGHATARAVSSGCKEDVHALREARNRLWKLIEESGAFQPWCMRLCDNGGSEIEVSLPSDRHDRTIKVTIETGS